MPTSKIVDSNSQENIEENIVARDEKHDKINRDEHSNRSDSSKTLNSVVHHGVPTLRIAIFRYV